MIELVTVLVDGKAVPHWEPRPDVYLSRAAYPTAADAERQAAAMKPGPAWTAADAESHRRTGYPTKGAT